ncbi:hypothetical protein K0M31_013664 [Melipona bicolor]|uniref:Uncharacterized protein n=1 Tax=Melipona bicolor TaxID=60889 RepID=A0AA40FIH0_9HYME|nr:hypothetical protein K0M31_013664 [Melipona bicolor]
MSRASASGIAMGIGHVGSREAGRNPGASPQPPCNNNNDDRTDNREDEDDGVTASIIKPRPRDNRISSGGQGGRGCRRTIRRDTRAKFSRQSAWNSFNASLHTREDLTKLREMSGFVARELFCRRKSKFASDIERNDIPTLNRSRIDFFRIEKFHLEVALDELSSDDTRPFPIADVSPIRTNFPNFTIVVRIFKALRTCHPRGTM